jgi:hypothetical protein
MGHDLTYDISYSLKYGYWDMLASGLKATAYEWNTLSGNIPDGSKCQLKIRSSCSEGLSTTAFSNVFTINNTLEQTSTTKTTSDRKTPGWTIHLLLIAVILVISRLERIKEC